MLLRSIAFVVFIVAPLTEHATFSADQRPLGGITGLVRVLGDSTVQSELSLDKNQERLAKELVELLRRVRDGKAQSIAKDKITKSLSDEQFERLEQVHWQRLGGRAILEPKVRDRLGIDEGQKKKLDDAKAINTVQHAKMLDFLRRARFRSREAMEKYKQGYRDAADKRLLGVWTEKQRAQLKRLLGKPFRPAA